MIIPVNDNIALELIDQKHGQELFSLINQNRSYLRQWLPWVDKMRSFQQFMIFIRESGKRATEGSELGCVILQDSHAIGRAGIYNIDKKAKAASLGYWLAAPFQGKGIITACCQSLIQYGFTNIEMQKLEIRCATNNPKSQAIAERLRFRRDGIIRHGEFLNRRFIDLYVYCLLKADWQNTQ